jgi:hypothetical protein
MAKATRLKNVDPRSSSMASPRTKFYDNPSIGSKVFSGDTQTGWWFGKPTLIFGKQAKNMLMDSMQ